MATNVERSLYLDYSNANKYMTASGAPQVGTTSPANAAIMMWNNGTTGTVTWNSSFMDALFPSESAIPNSMKYVGLLPPGTFGSSNCYMELRVDGTTLKKYTSFNSDSEVNDTFTSDAVTNAKKSSTITTYHYIPSSGLLRGGYSVRYFTAYMYFWKYDFSANIASSSNGISSVSVSNEHPYEGESSTFSCILEDGARFSGWYSDPDCTNLVSSDVEYVVSSANGDTTLYAKAQTGTPFYVNIYSTTPKKVVRVFKKNSDNTWVEQTDMNDVYSYLQQNNIKYQRILPEVD